MEYPMTYEEFKKKCIEKTKKSNYVPNTKTANEWLQSDEVDDLIKDSYEQECIRFEKCFNDASISGVGHLLMMCYDGD